MQYVQYITTCGTGKRVDPRGGAGFHQKYLARSAPCARSRAIAQVLCSSLVRSGIEEIRVHFNVAFPLIRDRRFFEDRGQGAGRFTGATVNTLIWIDKELFVLIKASLTWRRMNAIYRTNVDA